MSGVTLDCQKAQAAFAKLLRVVDSLPQIAEQARAESLGVLILGVNRNVYSTQRGAYQRTGELRSGLDARKVSSRSQASIIVSSAAPYSREVELGQGGNALSLPQDQQLAQSGKPGSPISLGRSGVNYSLPGVFVAPAQAYALSRMKELFVLAVRRGSY